MPASSLGSYASFLQALIALGSKLPEVFASIQRIVAEVQMLVGLLKPSASPDAGTLQLVSVTTEEAEMEAQIASMIVGGSSLALFDGTLLRKVYAFAKEHPELIALLMSLLKG